MIIDCHCHAGTGDSLTAPWNTGASLHHYLRRAARAGIARTVVFAPFHSDYARANAEVARLVAAYPNRLIGFAFVHPQRDAGRIAAMVAYAVRKWGFRGIKVHGYDGMLTREVCDTALRLRVPILVDVVGKVEVIEMFAPEYPDVNFIIPHLGSFADDWRAQSRMVDYLARYPNVYADTSGVRRFDYLVEAVKQAGAAKLLFGSDGPWLHPAVELLKIRALELPPHQERLITGINLLRLIQTVPATPDQQRLPGSELTAYGVRPSSSPPFADGLMLAQMQQEHQL